MAGENTPPASPREEINDLIDGEEEDMTEEGAFEVIDLDEALGDEDLEDDMNDQDGQDRIPEEGNSTLIFSEHKSAYLVYKRLQSTHVDIVESFIPFRVRILCHYSA